MRSLDHRAWPVLGFARSALKTALWRWRERESDDSGAPRLKFALVGLRIAPAEPRSARKCCGESGGARIDVSDIDRSRSGAEICSITE
jgi:hypothetical protein